MNQLENLLNSLIKMGWKPFGMEIHVEYIDRIIVEGSTMHIIFKGDGEYIEGLRTLVSQESGLWQFCMEKGLCRKNGNNWSQYHIHPLEYELNYSSNEDYQYRLIESALVPEEELAQFLIDNIKTE